jgi:hypothetical protein
MGGVIQELFVRMDGRTDAVVALLGLVVLSTYRRGNFTCSNRWYSAKSHGDDTY